MNDYFLSTDDPVVVVRGGISSIHAEVKAAGGLVGQVGLEVGLVGQAGRSGWSPMISAPRWASSRRS
jgi:hypothetical protein